MAVGVGLDATRGLALGATVDPQAARLIAAIAIPMMVVALMVVCTQREALIEGYRGANAPNVITVTRGAESYDAAMSDRPQEEIQVSWTTYGSLASSAPRDRTPTFKLGDTYLRSREVARAGHRYFIVTRPDWTVQRFRQNPQSGEAEPVDSIPGGDPA
ncbi:MAG TPA: hypothetical protein VI434_02425 [Candidatus Dormibacteraeota bacterium]